MPSQQLTIKAGKPQAHYWRDLWRYRELLYFLGWRDLLVRYKQTVLGVAWAILKPAVSMIVFTVIFGTLAQMPSEGVPYPILVFAGLLPWQFFSNAITESGNSLIFNSHLVSKIYFPRIIVPLSSVIVTIVDFAISAVIMVFLMAWYRYQPGWHIVFLPGFMVLMLALATGIGLWFAALNVKYRDFKYLVPFVVQLGVYASPVGFSSSVVPVHWRPLYTLNPMVTIIDGFRWSLIGGQFAGTWQELVVCSLVVLALLFGGLQYFKMAERTFADII